MRRHHVILPLVVFAMLAALVHFWAATERARLGQDLRTSVSRDALALVARLEGQLNANVFLANGMVAHIIASDGRLDARADQALRALQEHGRHIRNIGVAPGNRISHVYPREGNEAALGLYYPDHPAQWPDVKRAIDRRATILAGPVALRQGGSGLISRTPVFLPDGRYWGIISIVLDVDSVWRAAGLAEVAGDVRYALARTGEDGAVGDAFFGDEALFSADSVRFDVRVPGATWRLAAAPTGGWEVGVRGALFLELAGLALAALVAFGLRGYLAERDRVEANQRRLRVFLDTTRDGVIAIDQQGTVLEFNPAAERLFGYDAKEIIGGSVNRLMPPHYAEAHDHHVAHPQGSASRDMTGGREVMGLRKDGREFPLEVTVGDARVGGRRIFVGIVRDITGRKETERKLRTLATTDGLTGALNRRAFLEALEDAAALARRHDRPLCVMMIDADHFKRVNDTYGHPVGDAVLVRLSQVAQGCLRATDRFGRFGGEEFAVLLPETDAVQATEVAERLLAAVRETEVPAGDGSAVRFTVSLGIAGLAPDTGGVEDLLRAADAALYAAKTGGRDQWRVAEAPPP